MLDRRHQIISRLRSVSRQEYSYQFFRGILLSIGVFSVLALALSSLEVWLHTSVHMRTVAWWLLVAATAGSAVLACGMPFLRLTGLLQGASPESMALRVGNHYPDIKDDLVNSLQITRDQTMVQDLSRAAFEAVEQTMRERDFAVVIDRKPIRTALLFSLTSSAVLVALLSLAAETFGAGWHRLTNYDVSFVPPAPFTLKLQTLRSSVMRGESSEVLITATGIPPETITVHLRESSASVFRQHVVRRDSGNTFSYQIPGLTQSVEVFAESPWLDTKVRSNTGRISVLDRPLIRALMGVVTPPAYTKLASSRIDATHADVTAITGSVATLKIESNKKLQRAYIVMRPTASDTAAADSSIIELKVYENTASGGFQVKRNGTYSLHLVDVDGTGNVDPLRASIVALTDSFPLISLISPKDNVELRQDAQLPIEFAISDDFGFSHLRLYYRLTASRYAAAEKKYSTLDIPISNQTLSQDVRYTWNLGKIGMTPEDTYEFYLEVGDNDIVMGPKTSKTSTISVRMPSLDEVFAETDRQQSDIRKEMKEMTREAETIKKEAEQLQRELQKQQSKQQMEASWADRKKAEDLVKRQQELEQRMEKMADKLQEMTEKLRDNKAISEETLKKYQELQQLMREVKSPELERMQEQMRKAMEQVSPEELQSMMKDFKFNEEEFRKNLERQLSLLKRMQVEQKTDELAKRAEELARKQEELRQRTEQTNPNDKNTNAKLADEQKRLQEELEQLGRESKDLEQLMKEIGQDMPQEKMQQAQNDLNSTQTQQQMNDAEQQMRQGQNEQASQEQRQASQNLQRFAQQMKNMKREMRRNSMREAMRQMQKSTDDLLQLSKQQESLREQMKGLNPNSTQMSQLAQQQQRLQESMQNIANNMMQLGQRSTSVTPDMAQDLGDALESMRDAMKAMSDRNSMQAMQSQSSAMRSMNGAASKMGSAMAQMMQGEGAGQGGNGQMPGQGEGRGMSPFQRLQQLAEQQQSINNSMSQMGKGGQQLSQQERAEMGRLAGQQGKALRAIQEVEDQQRRSPSGDKQPLGDLNRIAKDMEEVMSDMQTGNITSETRQRQDRILSRLLDATRSMNERDYEKNRESTAGKDVNKQSPREIDDLRVKTLQRSNIEALRKEYSVDYENLIRQYFEALQRQRLSQGTRP